MNWAVGDAVLPIFWAALGIIATTLLTIIITKFANWLLQQTSQVIAEVSINEAFASQKILDDFRAQYVAAIRESKEPLKHLSFELIDGYRQYFTANKYIHIQVRNNTPKKLNGLSFSVDGPALMQVGDGPFLELSSKTPFVLGDLQPRRTLTLHVLCSGFWVYSQKLAKQALVFSADEHVRVRYKFLLPPHVKGQVMKYMFFAAAAVWAVLLILLAAAGTKANN